MINMPRMANGPAYNPNFGTGWSDPNYEIFDPLNWLMDGLVDFPYNFTAVQGLEQEGPGVPEGTAI